MKLNENNPWFKNKYKRSPKHWTISKLHDLYLLTKERHLKINALKKEVANEIFSKIPDNKYNWGLVKRVYFINNGNTVSIDFRFKNNGTDYSYSTSILNFNNGDLTYKRNNKIALLEGTALELGERFRYLETCNSKYLHLRILNVIEEKINKILSDKYDGINAAYLKKIHIVSINDHKYVVKLDDKSYDNYKKFSIIESFDENVLIIN